MSETSSWGGRRVVLLIYAVAVSVAGMFGFTLGFVMNPKPGQIAAFGPVTFALTPVNLAIYGMLAIGSLLAVGLALVLLASRRIDEESGDPATR